MEADPDSDIYVPDGVQDEASSPEDQPEEDELHSDGAPASVTQMIQETVAECPGAFLKFCVTNPAIVTKDNKKKAAAEKRRQTAAEKRASKPKSSTKRKKVQTADSEEDEERETKKTKEKYIARGLVMFKSSTLYTNFLLSVAEQLPCVIEDIIQEKITWRFQTPMKSTYLPLSGEIGFASMPTVEKPFWDDDDTKTFDFSELDTVSTHDHIVEQRLSFDKSIGPHKDALLEKYPEGNNPLFPDKRIYTNNKMNAHWDLTDLELSVWAAHLARGTATLEKPPISGHFNYSARILDVPKRAEYMPLPLALTMAPAPLVTTPIAPVPQALPTASTTLGGTSLVDLMVLNMMQQQQQQQQYWPPFPYYGPYPHPSGFSPAPSVVTPPTVPSAPAQAPNLAVKSAPQSPANFQLPNVSLPAFCERYNVNAVDQERLEKLEFQPGDKINTLPEAKWKTFAGFTSLSWCRILDKNHMFVHNARTGQWV
ncbi:hypothetical protein B0H34DRAFT_861891 [Crassisporium funariophilum]|nr:hypothetical protein B0H34DRAFT_861891 [Crassisporium funariophilum]